MLAIAFVVSQLLGCAGTWRPGAVQVETAESDAQPDVASFLRAARSGTWVYERRELSGGERGRPTRYVRRISEGRLIEGSLAGRLFLPIEEYLTPDDAAPPDASHPDRPRAPMEPDTGLFIRLENPLPVIPEGMSPGESIRSTTPFHYYDERGRPASSGTLTRVVEIEGFEDVTCPAGRFERCLRVRVELIVRFSWFMGLDLTSYLWLAPEVGEVRRVHRLSGWLLIFWFGSAHEYELRAHFPGPVNDKALAPSPAWSTGAVQFERILPRPQIAGMVIDFAPATAPAP